MRPMRVAMLELAIDQVRALVFEAERSEEKAIEKAAAGARHRLWHEGDARLATILSAQWRCSRCWCPSALLSSPDC